MSNLHLHVMLLEERGISTSVNTILEQQASIKPLINQDVTAKDGNFSTTIYDITGFFGTESKEELEKYEKILQRCESGPCAFLLVIKADRFTEEERETVEKIEKILGEKHLKNSWIVFTNGDNLENENTTIQEFINQSEPLKKLIQKYDNRYHVFNNKTIGHSVQVNSLITKVFQKEILPKNIPIKMQDTAVSSLSSRRIVLVGKSGVGKSAAGNTILGQREFSSVMSSNSVTSVCSEAQATVSGRSVSVVDTPGLLDTNMNPEELMTEIARSVFLSSPGPHAFLIVFPVNMRFTEQEQQIADQVETLFGQGVLKYSIILFTHGDQLEGTTVEKLIQENCRLRHLVQECGDRYQLFNNKDLNNREQVNDLLQKIDSMIQQNGGGHYSNQMYEDAHRLRQEGRQRKEEERKLQEEIERVRKETERIREVMEAMITELERLKKERQRDEERKQKEEKQRQEIERVKRETEEKIRAEMEAIRAELVRFSDKRQRDEEERKQKEKQRREDERETGEKIRAEMEAIRAELVRFSEERQRGAKEKEQRQEIESRTENEIEGNSVTLELKRLEAIAMEIFAAYKKDGFQQFFSTNQNHFIMQVVAAGLTVGGAAVGYYFGGRVGRVLGGAIVGGVACGCMSGSSTKAIQGVINGAVVGNLVYRLDKNYLS